MKSILGLLSRLKPKTFKVSYSPEYQTFLPHHIANDSQHPLCILRRRELNARKREGLWWHVTSGGDLSKSGVVRSWCRRRLRGAFTQGLKERGFDEFGRLVNADILTREHNEFDRILGRNKELSLTGSLRIHIVPALVAAKYADVRKETNGLIDILLEGMKADFYSLHHSTAHRHTSLPASTKPTQPSARSNTSAQSRTPAQTKTSSKPKTSPQVYTPSPTKTLPPSRPSSQSKGPLPSNMLDIPAPSTTKPSQNFTIRKVQR